MRESIAEQMQASALDSNPLDASQVFLVEPFWGSIPEIGSHEVAGNRSGDDLPLGSTTPAALPGAMPSVSSPADAATGELEAGTAGQPPASVEADSGTRGDPPEPDRLSQNEVASANGESSDTTPQEAPASGFPSDGVESNSEEILPRQDAVQSVPNQSASEYSEPMELEAPAAPALSADEVRSLVEEYADRMSHKGEIFRLDAPSYQEPNDATEGVEESDDLSSVAEDVAVSSEGETTFSREAAIEAEEELRRMQTQQFNPAWEVDQFQWPAVCNELTSIQESGLEQVAENLVRASEEGLHVMAVTSPQAGEGRTTVACCLAKLAGAHGLRVAFVDGDVEKSIPVKPD